MKLSVKKVIASFLVLVTLITSSAVFTQPAQAQVPSICDIRALLGLIPGVPNAGTTPWYDYHICDFSDKVFGAPEEELFGERYTYAQVNWIINSLTIQFTPFGLFKPTWVTNIRNLFNMSYVTPDQLPTLKQYADLGPMGLLVGSIETMYRNPVASGIDSVKSTLAKFSPVTPAYAQGGYGHNAINALQTLWSASRNSAYLFLIILLVISGFMIMFRVKVNPQTAVNLQVMIPKIIMTLLTITFSYAIAGFVIDLVYVALSLVIAALNTGTPHVIADANVAIEFFSTPNFGQIALYYIFFLVMLTLVFTFIFVVPGIFNLVLLIIVLFLLFKIWFMMLKTYITLMALIIFAPWQIMLGLLPGNEGFGGWLRSIIANASVFVVVPVMFMLNMLVWSTNWAGGASIDPGAVISYLFDAYNLIVPGVPDFIGLGGNLPQFPLFGNKGALFHLGLGYAILSLIPKAADIVRDALKLKPFKHGSAMGEALGPVTGSVGGTLGSWGAGMSKTATGPAGHIYGGILSSIGGAVSRAGK